MRGNGNGRPGRGVPAAVEGHMVYCDACGGGPAVYHLTLRVEVYGPSSTRIKLAQLWLCERCERKNRVLLEQRDGRAGRVARALTPQPAHWLPDDEHEARLEAYRQAVESGLGGV